MHRIRLVVIALVVWLLLFFSVERLYEPINISRVAYPFVPLLAALVILIPRIRQVPLWLLLVVPTPIFVGLKAWAGYQIVGAALPLTVTELCAIGVTVMLARWVSNGVSEFEHAVAHISIGEVGSSAEPLPSGEAQMYREVRRARHYQRPLTLLAVGIEEDSIPVALDRMVHEAQHAMMKRYVISSVARTLCDELEDYNLVAQGNSHFLILLPERTPEGAAQVAERLRQVVCDQVGARLKIGSACFPQDAVTFESLVVKAHATMTGKA